MIKLKPLIIKENLDLQTQIQELLKKYPNEYYEVANYGYGDGHCNVPLNAYDALKLSLEERPIPKNLPSWVSHTTLLELFENRLLKKYSTQKKPINYITDTDESDEFSGNPGDI